jgi:exodeoxyribonuclease V beta subunit
MAASGEAPASGGMLSLSVCRRSSPPLITALNRLFAGPDGRGTGFLLDGVDYVPVAPPAAGARAPLRAGGREVPALTLCVLEADGKPVGVTRMREVMAADAAARVRALIDDASIDVDGERLRPGQVAILVRDRSDAQQMLVALRRWGVESAYLNRDSVLSSAAARALRDVLAAVASPGDEGLLRNVLLGPLVGLGFDALRARVADEVAWQQDVERFRRYGDAWRRQGVLVMLRNFMADYDVARVVLARSGGARLLTDVRHVGELLHAQSAARPGSEALLRWLDRHDERLAEDEAQQMRLESDENLVKVVTIHGAKGLEWDVVLVPFATPGRSDTPGVWHRAEGAGYRAVWDVLETRTDDVDRERLAEDLRLLYVAVTRARRALFLSVCHCDRRGGRESNVPFARSALAHVLFGAAASSAAVADLRPRLQALRDGCDAIAIVDVDGDADTAAATSGAAAAQDATAVPPAEAGMPVPAARRFGGSIDRSYRVTSYTSLVAADADAAGAAAAAMADAEPGAADEGADIDDGGGRADDAIEARFPRGAAAGVALHALLEEMAREGTAIDAAAVEGTLRAHGLHQVARDAAAVLAWLTRVRGTRLAPLDLALDGCRRAVAEMEFTLPLAPLDTRALWSLLRAHGYRGDPLPSRRLAGLLRGYIDLVVAHDGGYCIVDYKSNALGATPAAYGDAAMQRAMREHRYDLQMLLYTLALRRHLRAHRREARIDVFYLFLRGVDGSGNGIWHHAPDAAVLDALDALFDGSGAPVR